MAESATSKAFREHVEELERRAEAGDQFDMTTLACLSLLAEGWRYGDPDPEDGPPDGGGEPAELPHNVIPFKRAA